MPQMGESVVEGTVVKWLVHEGEKVSEDQPLVEISTDKVDTEIPSPAAGVISKIIAAEGQTLPVGAQLAVIESATGTPSATVSAKPASAQASAPAQAPRTATQPANVESPPAIAIAPAASSAATVALKESAASAHNATDAVARYSPLVMKIASEHGIDLSRVAGTGIGGRVSKRDVLKYLESLSHKTGSQASVSDGSVAPADVRRDLPTALSGGAAPAPAGTTVFRAPFYQPREGDEVEPFSRRRKLIAEHMVFSKTHSPHVPIVAEIDFTRAAKLRDSYKTAFRAKEGFNLTFLPFVVYAAVRALKEFPRVNASVVGDSLVIRKDINLGVAVDTEEGLVVPVIRNADQHSIVGLAREIDRLARRATERKVTPDDLAGGSFTVSNPGREGNLFGFAIINQPQIGILRMGEVKKRPVVIEIDGEDAIAIRTMMYLTMSYDHRVIDGVLGNRFLHRVARLLEAADFEL
jgi:pyruvate/2-oxoglutarate dehydrogenase complex dihydrolipoamide acyltransferase (E2) component